MTEARFSELVNLYLDDEISREELSEFSLELANRADRKLEFQKRCRLHQALRLVFDPDVSSRAAVTQSSRWGYLLGGMGLAACFTMSAFLVQPFWSSAVDTVALPLNDLGDLRAEVEDLAAVPAANLERLVRSKSPLSGAGHASLTAHLRLLGLQPGIVTSERSMYAVQHASLQPRDTQARELERFKQWPQHRSMPEAQVYTETQYSGSTAEFESRRSEGFHSTLAGFR
ncbi:MAG: hypothetical protein ACI81V_000928 [Lentimonas sp.]|jgi:hypothetical protein